MKNKALDTIMIIGLTAACVVLSFEVFQQKQTIKEYKQITNEAIQVAEECLRVKK